MDKPMRDSCGSERDSKITKDTLIPVGLLIVLAGMVWGLSGDRARALTQIEQHEKRIVVIEQKIDTVLDGVRRIEGVLGASPLVKSQRPQNKPGEG